MMKKFRQKLTVALSAALMLSAMPTGVINAVMNVSDAEAGQQSYDYVPESEWTQNLAYIIKGNEVTITGTVNDISEYPDDIVIPAEIEGLPVTEIADEAFLVYRTNATMRSATIPPSVTNIGNASIGYIYEFMNPIDPAAIMPPNPDVTTSVTMLPPYEGGGEKYGYFTGTYMAMQMYEWFGAHIRNGFAIIGYEGTAAEEYAKKEDNIIGHTFKFGFIPLSDSKTEETDDYPDEKLWSTDVLDYIIENGEARIT